MPAFATVKIIQDLPVRYLDSKPFKKKIEITKIQGSLSAALIAAIDKLAESDAVHEDVKEKWKKIKGAATQSEQGTSKENRDSSMTELSKAENSLYVFHFRHRFKHPIARGRLIYALTFWNPFELIDSVGQMHGFFLDPPFQVVVPKTKEQWIKDMIDEFTRKNRPVTKRDISFFKKTYKRFVDQRKWINVLFIPTWTVDGVLSIHSRVSGIQSVTSVLVKTKETFAEVFPQHEVLQSVAESQEAVLGAASREMHVLGDRLRTANQKVEESRRREIEKDVRINIASGMTEYPTLQPSVFPKPSTAQKLGVEGWPKDDILNLIPIVIGLFLISGFAANPVALTGLGIMGTILLVTGIIVYFWRKRSTLSIPTVIKEKAQEAKETVEEKTRGP